MAIDESKYTAFQQFLLNLLSLLTILPLAPYLNRYIPPLVVEGWHLDMLVAVLVSFFITRVLLWVFKPLIIPALCWYAGCWPLIILPTAIRSTMC